MGEPPCEPAEGIGGGSFNPDHRKDNHHSWGAAVVDGAPFGAVERKRDDLT